MNKSAAPSTGDIGTLARTYAVVREIGRGGMGAVLLARHREAQHLAAIKVATPEKVGTDALSRFAREARLMARLRHPNIVGLYAIEPIGGGRIGIVMEYVKGQSLSRILARTEQLPLEECLRIVRDLGSALSYAHANGVVHRDVKPQNVLVDDATGAAKLADFGIAKVIGEASDVTATGAAMGTPGYMSPEQIDGSSLDGRSDIYSLGLVAWEMVTGQRPWAGEQLFKLLYKQKHEALPDLVLFRPDTPPRVRLALEGALAKEADARWASVGDMLAQLEQDEPTPAMIARRQREASIVRRRIRPSSSDDATVPVRPRTAARERDDEPVVARASSSPGDPHADTLAPPAAGGAAPSAAGGFPAGPAAGESGESLGAGVHPSPVVTSIRRPTWLLFPGGLVIGGIIAIAFVWGAEQVSPSREGASDRRGRDATAAGTVVAEAAPDRDTAGAPPLAVARRRDEPEAGREKATRSTEALAAAPRGLTPSAPLNAGRAKIDAESAAPVAPPRPSTPPPASAPAAASQPTPRGSSFPSRSLPPGNRASDPLDARAQAFGLATRARQLMAWRTNTAETAKLVDSALILDPRSSVAYLVRARLREAEGQRRDAWTDVELGARTGGTWEALALATKLRARESGTGFARQLLKGEVASALTPRRQLDAEHAAWLAAALAQAGDSTTALAVLEQANASDSRLAGLLSDPLLDPLRRSTRFREVVRRAAR